LSCALAVYRQAEAPLSAQAPPKAALNCTASTVKVWTAPFSDRPSPES